MQLTDVVPIFEKVEKFDGECLSSLIELSKQFQEFNKFLKEDVDIPDYCDRLKLWHKFKKLQQQ